MRVLVKSAALLLLVVVCGAAQSADGDARELYNALNTLHVDSEHTYYVRDITVRRDAVRFSFQEGKLAFLSPYNGRMTGLVFTGRGRVLAVPRDPVEKQSIARFLGTPLVDQSFSRAYVRFTDNTAEEILKQLKESGTLPASEPSFGEEWNAVAASLNSWHSLRILADWLAKETQPYFYAGLQGDTAGAFDVLVDNRREEQVLLGQPRWVNGVRYYEVWTSFLRSGSEAPPAPVAPVAYAVETTIEPDRNLTGVTTAELKALREGERMIPLELSRYLKVESVTDEAGRALVFFQNEEVTRHQIAQRGNDSLFVVKAEPTRAGEAVRLRIGYRGSVISDAGNGVYFVGERGSWYPHVGGSDRFVPFDLKFRWPRKLELVATGRKVEEGEEGEWKTGRWKSEVPIPVAGFNLGNYVKERVDGGRFAVEMYANEELEMAVLNRFVRAQRPPVMPRPPLVSRPGTLAPPPAALVLPDPPPPSPSAVLKELGNDVAEAIRFNEKLSGPFPYEKLAVAQIPGSFGQGWPGLLYLSTLSFLPSAAQSRAGIGERTQEQFLELVPAHEVVHQWWGNAVSWPSYRDQWLHEGLANYIALMYSDSKRPNEKVLASWLDYYRKDLASREPDGEQTIAEAGPLVLGYRLRTSRLPTGYIQVVYGKGTWVIHMLRTMLREPGAKNPDARFTQVLGALMESHRFRGLSTDDLQHALERRMTPAMDLEGGRSLDWFFDQWVRGTGIPHYAVSFQVTPQADGFVVKGKLKQSGVPDTFLATVPLYAQRTGAKPALLGNVFVSGPETSFKFVTKTPPKKILIDPNRTLLAVTE